MIGQHCLTHSHKLIIGKLISVSNWHLVHLFNLQDLGPTLGPKSGRVEIKLYKKHWICEHKKSENVAQLTFFHEKRPQKVSFHEQLELPGMVWLLPGLAVQGGPHLHLSLLPHPTHWCPAPVIPSRLFSNLWTPPAFLPSLPEQAHSFLYHYLIFLFSWIHNMSCLSVQ